MQFQVPQFIEVEDKIFGPLTFKQFVYVGGGLGASYLIWRELPIYLAGPLIALVGGLAAGLAFFKFNGQPFILALEHSFFYFLHSKLYLWNNEKRPRTQREAEQAAVTSSQVYIPKLSESRLHELAWSLDIKERIAGGTITENERNKLRQKEDVLAPIRTAKRALVQ